MDFVIVTGLSGAGKSSTIDCLEDLGFFCVDNLPPTFIDVFYDLCKTSTELQKAAVVIDIRGGDLFNAFIQKLDSLKSKNKDLTVLYLDAKSDVIINRFKETRRLHPLLERNDILLEEAVALEEQRLRPIKQIADFIIDTSSTKSSELKERIKEMFSSENQHKFRINVLSFGFKHGLPKEADIMFDVRFLANPFYIDELRNLTGLDEKVRSYVLSDSNANEFLAKVKDMINFTLPLYKKEGKSSLTIAFGCTGGHHRSVTFAIEFDKYLKEIGESVHLHHRDIKV